MHRKLEAKWLPLDTELERALRNLRKVKSEKSTTNNYGRVERDIATYSRRSSSRETSEENDYRGFLEANHSR